MSQKDPVAMALAENFQLNHSEICKPINIPGVPAIKVEPMAKMDFTISNNPFHHDLYHMGTYLSDSVMLMHTSGPMKYVIFVNLKTGERFKVMFDKSWQ